MMDDPHFQMMSADSSNIPGLDTILRGEIMRKDGLISQLVGQNKELMAAKDRQDIELTAQRETIQVGGVGGVQWHRGSSLTCPCAGAQNSH